MPPKRPRGIPDTGGPWAARLVKYTSPAPLVFVRHAIVVYDIDGPRAFLSSGPPLGTAVATVGSQELFGTEYAVEED